MKNIGLYNIRKFHIQDSNAFVNMISAYVYYVFYEYNLLYYPKEVNVEYRDKALLELYASLSDDAENPQIHLYIANIYYDIYNKSTKSKKDLELLHEAFKHYNVVVSLDKYENSFYCEYSKKKIIEILNLDELLEDKPFLQFNILNKVAIKKLSSVATRVNNLWGFDS